MYRKGFSDFISRNISRIKSSGPWLAEGKYVWIALGVNAVGLTIALRPGTGEPVIRITGLFLQVFGIATVIWGIAETRSLFGHTPVLKKASSWFKRCPWFRRHIALQVSGAAVTSSVGKLRAYGMTGSGANPTTETRLAALEQNILAIHERINATHRDIDEESQNVRNLFASESRSRQERDSELSVKLEATSTGGVHISAMGASWLFVGDGRAGNCCIFEMKLFNRNDTMSICIHQCQRPIKKTLALVLSC